MAKMAHQQIFDEVWENFVNWGCSPNIQIWLIEQMIAEWGKTEAEISTQNVNLLVSTIYIKALNIRYIKAGFWPWNKMMVEMNAKSWDQVDKHIWL